MCLLPSVRWGPNRDAHVECEYVERLHHQCATASSAGWAAKGEPTGDKTVRRASSSSTLSPPPPLDDIAAAGPGITSAGAQMRRRRSSSVLLSAIVDRKDQATGSTHTENERRTSR
ncbi:hypothetical protein MTO96_025581 [Rhipicephalus appendiculatus]